MNNLFAKCQNLITSFRATKESRGISIHHNTGELDPSTLVGMTILVAIVGIALSIVPPAQAAFYSFNTDNTTVTRNVSFDINVHLDTEGTASNAVDFVGQYDSRLFTLDNVQFNALFVDTFETIDNTNSTVSLAGSASSSDNAFNGADTFATLTLTPHTIGTGDISIDCDQSAIWRGNSAGTNLLDCTKLQNLTFTVTDGSQPQPRADEPVADASTNSNCSATIPPTPTNMYAQKGPANGQITLYWDGVAPITHYGISYGTSPGYYSTGASNVGRLPQFTISNLLPNTSYYFTVYAVNGCAISPISAESSAIAATSVIPGVNLTPEIVFVPLENQAGRVPSGNPAGRDASPSAIPQPTTTPVAVVDDTEDESFLSNIDPLLVLVILSGVVFVVALYIIGSKRNKHPHSSIESHLEPRHADRVDEHNSELPHPPQHHDPTLHQGTPKE